METPVVRGITLNSNGQATISPELNSVLFDIAIKMEEPTGLPVDVEHVVAGLVLASRAGQIDSCLELDSCDETLVEILTPHVKSIFIRLDGKVGKDD